MSVIVLDTGPLGMASNPKSSLENDACQQWVRDRVAEGTRVLLPEIADYEVRRELVRSGKTAGIARLDLMKSALEYLPITTEAMLLAADLWAKARREGYPTAPDPALDGDVILVAQALTAGISPNDLVIATVNVGHIARFVTARHWRNIP